MLWKILAKYGLPDSLIVVLRKMYSNIKITVSSGTAKTTFLSTSGGKQGDNVAALLFLFVMMAASELIDALEQIKPCKARAAHIGQEIHQPQGCRLLQDQAHIVLQVPIC